jgi:hypothetical protein
MALSSAHHPQTDRQTEVLNATIEQMLRAYVASDHSSWSEWLSIIGHAYNSAVHSSTLYLPNFVLMGYKPQIPAGLLVLSSDPVDHPFLPSQKGEDFVNLLESHCQFARDAPAMRDFIASKEYEVKAILGHQLTSWKTGNQSMYLVHWKGYDLTDDSWVSEYDLVTHLPYNMNIRL